MSRRPAPAIVPLLWDAFDRCDPTRSSELKTSVRMREARHLRRLVRALLFSVLAVSALALALLSNY